MTDNETTFFISQILQVKSVNTTETVFFPLSTSQDGSFSTGLTYQPPMKFD